MLELQEFLLGFSVLSITTNLGFLLQSSFHHLHVLGNGAALLMGSAVISQKYRPRDDIQFIHGEYSHPVKAIKLYEIVVPSSICIEALANEIN